LIVSAIPAHAVASIWSRNDATPSDRLSTWWEVA
jgi:hypothetical protein